MENTLMVKKQIHLLLLVALAVILSSAGCAPGVNPPAETAALQTAEPASGAIEITDGLDRPVRLEAPAQRVVSMAPSNTEILYAIGAGEQVIGRDEFSDFPAEAGDLPSVGGGFGDYNQEAIVELEPDLVLAAEINTPEQVQALADLGLNVFWLANPTSMDEMYSNLEILGRLTGHETEAAELAASLKERVAGVESKVADAAETPRVFYELDSTEPNAPWTAGPGTFIDTLIQMAGGENVAGDLDGQYLQISLENLVVEDPDVILLGDAAYGVTPESVGQRSGWESLSAVQDGRVHPFDDNLASRPGPRLVEGLETLAKLLHPELFE
jgi:iron complex transport system substrate-binding protein